MVATILDNWMNGLPPVQVTQFRSLYPVLVALLSQQRPGVDYEGPIVDLKVPLAEYDYVIIGGGSGGSVVGSRLSEDPDSKVLLLEAGMSDKDAPLSDIPIMVQFLQRSEIDWQYKTERQKGVCMNMVNQQCTWPRGKVLGGCSAINYMIYVRGNRLDYDNWANLGNPGWDYSSVLPYFKKSEDNKNRFKAADTQYHSTGGYMTVGDPPHKSPLTLSFMASASEMGYKVRDINGPKQTGFMLMQANIRNGKRVNMAKAFLQPARNRPNLHISVNSMVDKILFDENKRAYAVLFEKDGVVREVRARKEIILSAGAIGSPAILMRSGVGPADHLSNLKIPVVQDLPVGENLQDHLGVVAMPFLTPRGKGFHYNESPEGFTKYMNTARGPFTSVGVEALAFLNSKYADPSGEFPDIQFHFIPGGVGSDHGRALRKNMGYTDEVWKEYFEPIMDKEQWSVFAVLLRPESKGHIKLRSSNPQDPPAITANYLTEQKDVKTLVDAFRLMFEMSNTTAFQRVGSRPYERPFPGCENHVLFSDDYFECFVRHASQTIYHPTGTAKMGPASDPSAVVDPELRVHGVRGLRVVDASIMPKIVSGNTNTPVVMIAEKASDMIKESARRNANGNNAF